MSPSQINFLVFTSVWTILALIYLVLSQWRFERFAHKYAILGVETLTMLFWFAGFIALAVFLSDRVCFGNVCNSAKAAAAFAAFEWYVSRSSRIRPERERDIEGTESKEDHETRIQVANTHQGLLRHHNHNGHHPRLPHPRYHREQGRPRDGRSPQRIDAVSSFTIRPSHFFKFVTATARF